MPERASVFEGIQIGVETTAGTAASANRKLYGFDIDLDPMVPSEIVRPQGNKFATDLVNQKSWAEGSVKKGHLAYNDIVYFLSGLLCAESITTPTNNGVWVVPLGTATGGTFTLTFNGATTAAIAETAIASAIKTAFELLSTVGSGNTTVSRSGQNVTITLIGALAGDRHALTASGTSLTGPDSPYTVTPTTTAASTSRRWTYVPSNSSPDSPKTFTIEKGSSAGASRVTYGMWDQFEVSHSKKGAEIKAKLLAQTISDGISLTSTPTDVALRTVQPTEVSVYVGSSLTGLTLLTRCLEAKWGVKDRFSQVFTLDASASSFSAVVEKSCVVTGQIVVEQDSVADAFLVDLMARTEKFVRIVATGTNIETGFPYMIRTTFPFKFRQPKRGDHEDVYSGTFDLEGIYDSTLGGIEVIVDCAQTAL